jgi:nucleoid DNA-binding protein
MILKHSELINNVAISASLEAKTVRKAVEAVFPEHRRICEKGGDVSIPSFGKFKRQLRRGISGLNQANGEPIEIAAPRELSFGLAKQLRDALAC